MSAEIDAVVEVSSVIAEEKSLESVVLSSGYVAYIRKCKVKDTSAALRLMKALFDTVGVKRISDAATLDLEDIDTILQLIANSQEPLFYIASSLSGIKPDDFELLDLDDAIKIILKAFEVNKRFFSESVLPLVQNALRES